MLQLSLKKEHLIFGALTSGSSFLSFVTSYYFSGGNIAIVLWSCVFGIFFSFHRLGATKTQQVSYVLLSALLSVIILGITGLISILPAYYAPLMLSAIIFSVLCLHRYLKGNRNWSVFLVVYILLFHELFPHLSFEQFCHGFLQILIGLSVALGYTSILVYLLPLVVVPISPPNKNIYLVKQALRTTLLFNIAFIMGYFVNIRNVAWICFSILVISQENLQASLKKSLERALGTIIGAFIGMLGAHSLFNINPYITIILIFILIFFTYATISFNYIMGIGLATIWISASFYLYHLPITFNQFVLSRIIDTIIGIALGLLGEYLIFPIKPDKRKSRRTK